MINVTQKDLKIVVTGAVDSGKSTFIGRFLYESGSLPKGAVEEIDKVSRELNTDFEFAYLLDSFEEERKGQLTIDTTQIFCKTKKGRDLVFIDVPGHQELLKNMLTGSSHADMAILVVDAQKPIEEQTKRHAFILHFLGIKMIDVAINKMDAVGFDERAYKAARDKAASILKRIDAAAGYFIPIVAKEGENIFSKSDHMPWYNGPTISEALNSRVITARNAAFRFFVQDIYNTGNMKVAVGDIASGGIKKGETVSIIPVHKKRKVKGIAVLDKIRASAEAPAAVGLLLDDMTEIARGHIICKAPLPESKKEITARILCMISIRQNENLKLRCGTQETNVNLRRIKKNWDSAGLKPKTVSTLLGVSDIAEVVIDSDIPFVTERYDGSNRLGRFILKNAGKEICAVGISI